MNRLEQNITTGWVNRIFGDLKIKMRVFESLHEMYRGDAESLVIRNELDSNISLINFCASFLKRWKMYPLTLAEGYM